MVGNIVMAMAFTLIGPAPFLAELLPNSIGLSYFVASLIGVGYALIMVARLGARLIQSPKIGLGIVPNSSLSETLVFILNCIC